MPVDTRSTKPDDKDTTVQQEQPSDGGQEKANPTPILPTVEQTKPLLPTVVPDQQVPPAIVVNHHPVKDEQADQDEKDGLDFSEFGRGLKLKLPEFWGDQPETWFSQVEAVFWRYRVCTEERRYYLVVCHLPRQVAARVTDALKNPHLTKPYTSLKEHLISAFSVSQYQKDLDLVNYTPGKDERPSQTLDKMLSLLPNTEDKAKPSSLFTSMYFSKLDPQIRDHVVGMAYDRFRDVAMKADEHWFAKQATIESVAAVADWAKEVDVEEVNETLSINVLEDFCYYHRVFGKEAQNCRAPCRYKKTTSSDSKSNPKTSKNVKARRNRN